jgi:putative addiction module component (TIGR02574 family)
MRPTEIIREIDKLELSEKLILVTDIWDSIARSQSVLPMPEWQKSELDKRYEEYKSGKLGLYDWKEVHSMVREKNQ